MMRSPTLGVSNPVIGQRLRDLRESRNLTQRDLAKRVDIHVNQLVKWEKNNATPGGDALYKLAKELEVSTDYLLGLVNEKNGHLQETDLSPKESRILDAYRHGDWQRLLYEMATDELLKEKAIQEVLKSANDPALDEQSPKLE